MKVNGLFNNILGSLGNVGSAFKQYAPEVLMVGGGIGCIVGAVMACKATHDGLDDILEEHKEQMEEVRKEDGDAKKQKTVAVYAKTSLKVARLYAPSITVEALSLASIFASNNIMRKRNMALIASYTAVDKAYRAYRNRVVERFGEEVDKQLLTGTHEEKIEEEYIDENGKKKKRKQTINVADPNAESIYMKYIVPGNPYYEKDPDYMRMFLGNQMDLFNSKLRTKKFVCLNEVYQALGFQETKAGIVCGWRLHPNNPNADRKIIFTVHECCLPGEDGGYVHAYSIDFNVDGDIYKDFCDDYNGNNIM